MACGESKQPQRSIAKEVGQPLDSFNGVVVHYNGKIGNISGRNTTAGGYNLGLKYQCVEFVKRYYYEVYNHKMPNSYGNAKDFFQTKLADGKLNKERGLLQFHNTGTVAPQVGDIVVWGPTIWNKYGHVAIVSNVFRDGVEIVQQNGGPFSKSRKLLKRAKPGESRILKEANVLGWLRHPR